MKKILLFILLASPLGASQKYSFEDPKLDDEFSNNYKEHSYPFWTNARGSSMTVIQANISTVTVSGQIVFKDGTTQTTAPSAGVSLSSTNTWTATQSFDRALIKGTTSNDSANTGYVGEYVSSSTVSRNGTTGAFADLVSISLTAGDWDISCSLYVNKNGATWAAVYTGISTSSGNDETGLVYGTTRFNYTWALSATTPVDAGFHIPRVRAQLTATTTYYCKYSLSVSAGTPTVAGVISARRVR